MASLLKKVGDFINVNILDSNPSKPPPLDGEIIYSKNNVCVHPPSNLSTDLSHFPGYLTLRAQQKGETGSTLILTWIPNSTLKINKVSGDSSLNASPKLEPNKLHITTDETLEKKLEDEEIEESKEDRTSRDSAFCGEKSFSESEGDRKSLCGSIISQPESGIEVNEANEQTSEADKLNDVQQQTEENMDKEQELKAEESTGSESEIAEEPNQKEKQEQYGKEQKSTDTESSESGDIPVEDQLASLVASTRDETGSESASSSGRPTDLTLCSETEAKTDSRSLSSESTEPTSDQTSPLRKMLKELDLPGACHDSLSSSTTPTTSNKDQLSLPSTPASGDDPFNSQFNQDGNGESTDEPMYNMTFPANYVSYSTDSPSHSHGQGSARDQLCGVFSVDLGEMRSLRLFFLDREERNGQFVIASQESQYKVLHFHHSGLGKLAEILGDWKYAVRNTFKPFSFAGYIGSGVFPGPANKALPNADEETNRLCQKFSIVRPNWKKSECHPEEGMYDMITEDIWWSYLNECGQVEDEFGLRKAIFFGGIDEYVRREIWPFLLHFFNFDSTRQSRKDLREEKHKVYKEIDKKRLSMPQSEYEQFWRNIQSTVDKDVVRTDRSHKYYIGKNNRNVDVMRNILLNFAYENPSMGYTQGMSDLLSPVLAELQDESDTFWCFTGLMHNTLFFSSPKDDDMEKQLSYLRSLIELMLPLFWKHLLKLGDAMDLLFCHRWILLCFKREFPELEALQMWEACWSHYQTDYFHLFICIAIITVYGDDIVQQELPSDEMLLHFSNLSMQMSGDIVLKKARSLLYQFRTLPRISCELNGLCRTCGPGMWDSGHVPEVECIGNHKDGDVCPHIR
ncbi:TBC1 domain family member 16-like [Anneissia japonica]|uniref:TBC1 domain family member 16-like n=1 Tax=Anneissia japonica TaxID=1529436 RepID=UPI001425749B|nr:TBC1 domain family member 16-like [Anneissia japonica]